MTLDITKIHTVDELRETLAAYLPNDAELHGSKNVVGSLLYNITRGFSHELRVAESVLVALTDELIPDRTNRLVDLWERAVGIPDDCFTIEGLSIDQRAQQVVVKLASLGVQTEQDFIDLAALFGYTVTIDQGQEILSPFPYTFPLTFPVTASEAPYIIIVYFVPLSTEVFPYTFPLVFPGGTIPILDCLFNKLKPANCIVQFVPV